MSTVYTSSPIEAPKFGHAWRDAQGVVNAVVRLGSHGTDLSFDDSRLARELAAEILSAANAMDALPPAEGGQP